MADQWRTHRVEGLDGGLNLSRNPVLLNPAEGAEELNVEHDLNSVKLTGGAVKFNNQVARKPGALFRPDPALTPLSIEAGKSVPVRNYGYIPYSEDTDIGGDFVVDSGTPPTEVIHSRRGKSFNFEVSFQLPEEEKLYKNDSNGAGAPASTAVDDNLVASDFGYDEALDDCFIILQKGGDRMSPMSWFLGVTNVGGKAVRSPFREEYELQTEFPVDADRPSNYCLVFGWFDCGGWGQVGQDNMRYELDPTVGPTGGATGEYSTQAIRAVTIPHFVEPGREYHVAVKLQLDTETSMSASSWNDDGFFQVAVSEGLGPTQVYGYSKNNKIDYSEDFEKGVANTYWTENGTGDQTTAKVEQEGPEGQRFVTRITAGASATTAASINTPGTGNVWDSPASGQQWLVRTRVREVDSQFVQLRLRNVTDDVGYFADFEWVNGNLTLNQKDSTLLYAGVSKVPGMDGWWDATIVRQLDASDDGKAWQAIWYTGYTTLAGVPDIFEEDPNTSTDVEWIQVEQFTSTEPPTSVGYQPNYGIQVYKGPTDSLDYLCKYGIRYSSRDAVFVGLGYRMAPWQEAGFIPFGSDSAPLESGGFCMPDLSLETEATLYTGISYTLQFSRSVATTQRYLELTERAFTSGRVTAENQHPAGVTGLDWTGFGAAASGAPASDFNAEALRGYRIVFTGSHSTAALRGARFTIDTYVENGGNLVNCISSTTGALGSFGWTNQDGLVQCFRWNQRPLVISELRFYSVRAPTVAASSISPTADQAGNTNRTYTPSEVTSPHAKHRLTVFYPRPEVPRPPGGYPCHVRFESGAHFTEADPASAITKASDFHGWELINSGWVLISVGMTGTDSSGSSTIGAFSKFGSTRWDDYTEFFPQKDAVWARQWIGDNASTLGINNDRVVLCGNESAAEAAIYACAGADRAQSSGSTQVQQSTKVMGLLVTEARSWYRAFDSTSSGAPWLDANGARASTIADADPALIDASSPSRVVRETGANALTSAFFLSYDEAATSTDFTRLANGDPSLSDTITGLTRDYWFGVTLYTDLTNLDSTYHGLSSRLAVQDGLELVAPNNIETDLFTGSVGGSVHDTLAWGWHSGEFPYPVSRIERDYHDRRTQFSLRSEALLSDQLDPGIESLLARWPMDDGGGGVLRETVSGADGFVAPFALGVSRHGSRGQNQLFLSGEGEALQIDLGESPIFLREFDKMQRLGSTGVAIEITCVFPEAFYGTDDNIGPGNERLAKFAPHVATWEIADPTKSETNTTTQPLLALTSRVFWNQSTAAPILRPTGFQAGYSAGSDQADDGFSQNVPVLYNSAQAVPYTWNEDGRWVGKTITLQVGIQSTGTADTYDVYIAGSSARSLLAEDATETLGDREFNLYATPLRIEKKDLLRSVVTIGGCWDVATLANGYTEANCRMIVDEVRVFAAAAPGTIPADTLSTRYPVASGGLVTDRDGKLTGGKAFPARALTVEDILQPLGEGITTANVVDGSTTVTAPGRLQFYEAEAEDDIRATKETYLIVPGDPFENLEEETLGTQVQEFYLVDDVASGGGTLTLTTSFADATRTNAGARSMRILAYTNFADDIRDKPLPLGRGAAYDPATSTVDDATLTEDYFTNISPIGVNWRFRVYSPVPASSTAALIPGWVRGLQSPRRNPILGIHHINTRVLAASFGSLFEVDDRWRQDGPTDDLEEALSFLPKSTTAEVLLPRATDRVVFDDDSNVALVAADLNGVVRIFDAWVRPTSTGLYQTIMWVGSEDTDPQHEDGSHKVQLWIRLRDRFPQFCLKSTATFDGTSVPPQGLYVAEGARRLPLNEWTHVRWYLFSNTSGTILEQPKLKVGGKGSSVSLNNVETGLSGDDWLTLSTVVTPGDEGRILIGAARDAFSDIETDADFEAGEFKGRCKRPDHRSGYMHSMGGDLAQVAIVDSSSITSPPPDFDPTSLDYGSAPYTETQFLAGMQEGVGHKVEDTGGSQFGVIHSHPFLSLFHEMGSSGNRVNFATYGNEVFMANGGRVVVEEEGRARFAGVPAPTKEPDFEIVRNPLWKPNVTAFDVGGNADTGNPIAGTNDPVSSSSVDDPERLLHYSTRGNQYLRQESHAEMNWEDKSEIVLSGGTEQRFFFVKMYFRMRNTAGRILIWSQKDSLASGKSIEIRDGKIGLFWWDTFLKKEVGVLTNEQVVEPGYVYYLYVRKEFPHQWNKDGPAEEADGNYLQSYFTQGNTYLITSTSGQTGTWRVGETFDDDATGAIDGVILRVHDSGGTTAIEYLATTGAFVGGENITGDASGATATNISAPVTVTRDNFVLRKFRQADSANAWNTDTPYDAKTNEASPSIVIDTNNCIGFPTDTRKAISPMTATGMVTPEPDQGQFTFTGNSDLGGVVCNHPVLHEDMRGMIFQFGTGPGASYEGNIYRILQVTSATTMFVRAENGTDPIDFLTAAITNAPGAVFSGVTLIKSDDFDESREPDLAEYDIHLAGSALQGSPETGITPFDGEIWCPGWGTCSTEGADRFAFFDAVAADLTETGTDFFTDEVYSTTGDHNALEYDGDAGGGRVFACVDPKLTAATYVTTQPNADLKVAVDTTHSSVNAKDLEWSTVNVNSLLDGTTTVYVTFYDPDNDLEGNPSPALVVRPGGEDDENPSGDATLRLISLPVKPGFWRRIYMTLIDGVDAFRVAEIQDDTSSSYSITKSQSEITGGLQLRFDRAEPPRCSIVAVSQLQMFYGNLDGQPDGVIPSRPFNPHAVPRSYEVNGAVVPATFVIDSGDDSAVTGMRDLQGRLVVFKRNMVKGVYASLGTVTVQDISEGVGCVSQQSISALDNTIYWIGTRGPMAFGGTGVPIYLGVKLEPYFTETLDPEWMSRISSTINRRRNQFTFTTKRQGSNYTHERISLEFDHELSGVAASLKRSAVHRITRCQDPNITALSEVDSRDGGPRLLIGGSEEGFMFWLDRRDVTSAGMGPDTDIHGARTLTADDVSSPVEVFTSTALDQALEGPRGVRLRWRADSADQEAVVLYAGFGVLGVDRKITATLPDSGDTLTLGALMMVWRSMHFSFGAPEQRKRLYYLDVTRDASGGSLYTDIYTDLSATPVDFPDSRVLDLATAVGELDLGPAQFHRYFQVRFSTRADQVDVDPELFEMTFRMMETESR